ncbi:hypothetical protein X975_26456, partial [Stegodyphus mimosarum]
MPEKNTSAKVKRMWQNRWAETTTGHRTFKFYPKINFKLNIRNWYITQFLTEHGSFSSYLKRFNFRTSDSCSCGEVG